VREDHQKAAAALVLEGNPSRSILPGCSVYTYRRKREPEAAALVP